MDPDALLPDLVEWIDTEYYNLFCNLDTGEHRASPVVRKGNAQYALRQSFKKSDLAKILRNSKISYKTPEGIFSNLFFQTLTFDHNRKTRDEANFYITNKGRGIANYFARLEKHIEGGYSKVIVKESTKDGYPAVHILLYLEKPLKVYYHRKSDSYRLDPSDSYTKKILGQFKNLDDWNSHSPIWGEGFMDIYAFTSDNMGMKGFANPVNYIAKYISKSLDIDRIEELRTCKRVSELPEKHRTAVWTLLNSLIWNSHTWVISNKFKKDLKKIQEKREKLKGNWMYVDTVHRTDPRLYAWMGYDVTKIELERTDPLQPAPT